MRQLLPDAGALARLADYFVEVVAEPSDAFLQDEDENFERKVETRIPATDHRDFALPDGVPYFCIPESVAFYNPSVYERKPTFFSFTLTQGDGTHAYGFALHVFEEFSTADSDWRPRVLCLISHHPFFSLFKEIVSWMYRSRYLKAEYSVVQTKIAHACEDCSWFLSPRHSTHLTQHQQQSFSSNGLSDGLRASLRSWRDGAANGNNSEVQGQYYQILRQLLRQAARPSSGEALSVRMDGRDFFRYHVQRGKAAHLDDYCFQMLFQCLSLKNVVYIINCLLLEQRVLVHSSHQGLLTPICEALCTLLFPFTWEHVFIPFLPVKLIEYLQAPVPYFIGLHTSSLATRVGSETFASCVVVHLDKDKVVSPIFSRIDGHPMDFALARLPSKEVRDLMSSLEGIIPSPIGSGSHTWSVARPSPESASQHASQTVNEVELTFGDGPLGITFESTHLRLLAASNFEPERQLGGSAVVKALPRLQNGLAGPAERSGMISAGSFLIGINREPTLDLTFEETIDYLRRAKRPIRLRFLNARLPYENACQFAERLQALSLVSALQTEHENLLLPWVDSLRGAFAAMFAGIFRDYQQYIGVERRESNAADGLGQRHALPEPENYGRMRRQSSALAFAVQFDHQAFCHSMQATDKHHFLREFTQTQSFAGFINESVMGRPMARPRGAYPPLELFKECVHLVRESNDARRAIALLFKRNSSPAESMALDLPMTPAKANDEVAVEAVVGLREAFGYCSISSEEGGAESSTKLTSIGALPVTEPAGTSSAVDLAPTESPSSSSSSSPLAEKADARNVLDVTAKQLPGLASPEQEEGGGSGAVEATLEADL